jgi:hypothetical protein
MQVSAVSGDMVVKLALFAAAGLALYVLAKKASAALPSLPSADQIAAGLDPLNPDNIVNQGVSAVGGSLVTDPAGPGKNADGSWTLGGWLYDVTH